MIHVIATVKIRTGCLQQALECYRWFVPQVLANEPGCVEYSPTTDVDLGLANQDLNQQMIYVNERWNSVEDFKAHLAMNHCVEFRKKITPYLDEGIRVRVSRQAI